MTGETHDLVSLLGSRICHDLISPLGAISNGVELLSMTGMGGSPELALITQSVENANARIRFFRIAFGSAARDAMIPFQEIREILDDMTSGSRLSVEMDQISGLRRAETKLIFLLIMCLETALPWGGSIEIHWVDQKGWVVTGQNTRIKTDPALWGILSSAPVNHDLEPAHIQFALAVEAAAKIERPLTCAFSDHKISISF